MCKGQRFLASKLRFIVMFVETPEKVGALCFFAISNPSYHFVVHFNNDNYLFASFPNFVVFRVPLL
jgi:hypothetical protein